MFFVILLEFFEPVHIFPALSLDKFTPPKEWKKPPSQPPRLLLFSVVRKFSLILLASKAPSYPPPHMYTIAIIISLNFLPFFFSPLSTSFLPFSYNTFCRFADAA